MIRMEIQAEKLIKMELFRMSKFLVPQCTRSLAWFKSLEVWHNTRMSRVHYQKSQCALKQMQEIDLTMYCMYSSVVKVEKSVILINHSLRHELEEPHCLNLQYG